MLGRLLQIIGANDKTTEIHLPQVLQEELICIHGKNGELDPAPAGTPEADPRDVENAEYAPIFRKFHEIRPTALCLSGGGIRSAAFALGVIQGLARIDPEQADPPASKQSSAPPKSFLHRVHYLSTVSGGGYVGGWLSAWIHRQGAERVFAELEGKNRSPTEPEPEPIRHLRHYSNYLTPRIGLFSADSWALFAIYLRNLLLNWLITLPILTAVFFLPYMAVWGIPFLVDSQGEPRWIMLGWATLLLMCGVIATAVLCPSPSQKGGAKWAYRIFVMAPICVAAPLICCFWAGRHPGAAPGSGSALSGWPYNLRWFHYAGFGAIVHLVAWLLHFPVKGMIGEFFQVNQADETKTKIRRQLEEERQRASVSRPRPHWALMMGLVAIGGACGGLGLNTLEVFGDTHGAVFAYRLLCDGFGNHNLNSKYLGPSSLHMKNNWEKSFREDNLDVRALRDWSFRTECRQFVCLGFPIVVCSYLCGAFLFVGLISRYTHDEAREWWSRSDACLLAVCVGWIILSAAALYAPEWMRWGVHRGRDWALSGGIAGIAGAGLSALMAYVGYRTRHDEGKGQDKLSSWIRFGVNAGLLLAIVFVLGCCALFAESILCYLMGKRETEWGKFILFRTPFMLAGECVVGLFVGAFWLDCLIDNNRFSLHGTYRNRLIRAFLGASRPALRAEDEDRANHQNRDPRDPNMFTGFDREDNIVMHNLRPDFLSLGNLPDGPGMVRKLVQHPAGSIASRVFEDMPHELRAQMNEGVGVQQQQAAIFYLNRWLLTKNLASSLSVSAHVREVSRNMEMLKSEFDIGREDRSRGPFHVVNLALNTMAGDRLAWQERKARGFTVTPLHCGNARLGYRLTREYGQGITLGTAMTISGAAANPSMGYHSSPLLSFLMTLFNLRLGWWLGNTGSSGQGCYRKESPRWGLLPMVQEAFGLASDHRAFVCLSDGGHFENLGIYEMVLRRCRFIVVSDATYDPEYALEDLANAIRKIKIDLGISIDIRVELPATNTHSVPIDESRKLRPIRLAIGKITYSDVDEGAPDGVLVYIKPAITGDEPPDISNYACSNKGFPHESTLDQWFSESQFESYRHLGEYTISECKESIIRTWKNHMILTPGLTQTMRAYGDFV